MASFKTIQRIISAAHESGRKHPVIVLCTAGGQRVKLHRAGDRSRFPGSIQVTDGRGYPSNTWFGSIALDGAFRPSRDCDQDVTDLLEQFDADPAGVAARYGLHTGQCCFCAKDLTDKRSVEVGYGPVCAGRYGLPWGEADKVEKDEEKLVAAASPQFVGISSNPIFDRQTKRIVVAGDDAEIYLHERVWSDREVELFYPQEICSRIKRAGKINLDHWSRV